MTAPARVASKAFRYFRLEKKEICEGRASSSGATPSIAAFPSPVTVPPTRAASSWSVKPMARLLLRGGRGGRLLRAGVVLADQLVGQVEGARPVDDRALLQ